MRHCNPHWLHDFKRHRSHISTSQPPDKYLAIASTATAIAFRATTIFDRLRQLFRPPDPATDQQINRAVKQLAKTHCRLSKLRKRRFRNLRPMNRMTAFPSVSTDEARQGPIDTKFDTDSSLLYIDNCTSSTLTPHRRDFASYRKLSSEKSILGIGGPAPGAIGIGTVKYNVIDDHGTSHTWEINDIYHVPTSPARLLSPQQFAQQRQSRHLDDFAHCDTRAYSIVIEWSEGDTSGPRRPYKITIPLNNDNVGTIPINTGFKSFQTFIRALPQFDHRSGYISDDDEDTDDTPREE